MAAWLGGKKIVQCQVGKTLWQRTLYIFTGNWLEATRCSKVLWWSYVGLLSCTFLACLGCSLGLLRTLWESLGPSLGVSWASLRDLGFLLGLLGLVGPLLGCSFGLSSALLDSLGLLLGVPFRTS